MKRATPTPNDEGLCDFCFWPMAGDKIWWNGAYGHARCVAEHERLVLGDDASPGLIEVLEDLDMMVVFLTRLDREAEVLGIDRQKLASAIERACHA
jgi:hypothetical protein